MNELEFAKEINKFGGTAYLVGGAVRDRFRGVEIHDRDYCITGLEEKIFASIFPEAIKFGKSFPVYSMNIDGKFCEIAFARLEQKIGSGYKGFRTYFDPSITIEQDLYRRDTTINAMAIEILTGKLLDPFGGREDVKNQKIRAVSKHFIEDPVRALRAARQAAQFNFKICEKTLEAMKACRKELLQEPSERIFNELEIVLATEKPSIFFRCLEQAELLEVTFPEIFKLRKKIQSEIFHPEGDAYEHSLKVLDEVAKINSKPLVRFSALIHDIGKGETPKEILPHHYFHEKRGIEVLEKLNNRMTLPNTWREFSKFIIKEHMRAPCLAHAGKIVDLLLQLRRFNFDVKDFCDIIKIDHHGLPEYLENAEKILNEITKISGRDAPTNLKGVEIGKWIRRKQIKCFVDLRKNYYGT